MPVSKNVPAGMYSGAVLQVVQATTNTTTTVAANTYTDTTLSASITPTSSSSKILILVNQQCNVQVAAGSTNGLGLRILRGSTTIFDPSPIDGSNGPYLIYGPVTSGIWTVASLSYLDSPATTSSTTYKTQGRPYDASVSNIIFQTNAATQKATSVITLLEIAA